MKEKIKGFVLLLQILTVLIWPSISLGEVDTLDYEEFLGYRAEEEFDFLNGISKEDINFQRLNNQGYMGETPIGFELDREVHYTMSELINERGWVSIQLMSSILGYDVAWIESTREMLIKKDAGKNSIWISLKEGEENARIWADFPSSYAFEIELLGEIYFNHQGHLMISLNDLTKSLGYDISWNSDLKMISLKSPNDNELKFNVLSWIKENEELVLSGYFEELKKDEPEELSFILLGDMGLGTNYGRRNPFDQLWLEKGGGYFLSYLQEEFEKADMVITNLENVFTNRSEHQRGKIYTYKAHRIEYLDVLSLGNITHVNVVNNHMVDYLQAGFDDTLKYLDDYNIEWFGTNLSTTSNIEIGNIRVDKSLIFEENGIKVGLLGYLGFNSSFVSDDKIIEDIQMLRDNGVDYIVASMHWGGQNTHELTYRQRYMGRKLIDFGVDLVYGHHPHVLQELEIYNGKPIYYSFGNFMFIDYRSAKDPDSVMVRVDLFRNEEGILETTLNHIPIFWSGHHVQNHYSPKIMDDDRYIKRVMDKLKINELIMKLQ